MSESTAMTDGPEQSEPVAAAATATATPTPTPTASDATKPATPITTPVAAVAAPPKLPTPEEQAQVEYTRLSAHVAAKPSDFEAWGQLVGAAEKTGNSSHIRNALSSLLAEYPLCFGYWQRYANYEKNNGTPESVISVLEQGTSATPHSHELWTFYCMHLIQTKQPTQHIRTVFERAATAIASDATAGPFWDKYLEFEHSVATPSAVPETKADVPVPGVPDSPPTRSTLVGSVYAQLLQHPLKDIERFYSLFHAWVAAQPLIDLMTEQEWKAYTQIVTEAQNTANGTASSAGSESESDSSSDPSRANGVPPLQETLARLEATHRGTTMASRDTMFRASKAVRDDRHVYESKLSRPYFHVAPLDNVEIITWHNYLDYVEAQAIKYKQTQASDFPSPFAESTRVYRSSSDSLSLLSPSPLAVLTAHAQSDVTVRQLIKLYERCLVAAAKYHEFWDRYALFIEEVTDDVASAAQIRQREITVFLKNNSDTLLSCALFHARQGPCHVTLADSLFQRLRASVSSWTLSLSQQHVNFLRKCEASVGMLSIHDDVTEEPIIPLDSLHEYQQQQTQRYQQTISTWKQDIQTFANNATKPDDYKSFVALSLEFARFLQTVIYDGVQARAVYQAIADQSKAAPADTNPTQLQFWLQYIQFETQQPGDRVGSILSLYVSCLESMAKWHEDEKKSHCPRSTCFHPTSHIYTKTSTNFVGQITKSITAWC